jgi:dTDP-4-dehydrorhamnose reductase
MKVVVFGCSGQLGNELARAAWPENVEILGPPEAQADITDADAVKRVLGAESIAMVINAAAYTAVDKAESERDLAFRVNCHGAANLAAVCAAAKIPLLHVSTDYVFDGTKGTAYVEDDPVRPLGVYGESKAAGETAVRAAVREHLIVRTSWLVSSFGQNFVKTMLRLAKERDTLRVVADQFGRPTPARDLAAGLVAVVAKHLRGDGVSWGTYHFAGAGRASWHDLAVRIVELQARHTSRQPRVEAIATAEYPTPARRPVNSELDTSKFEHEFGYQPKPWQLGVEQIVAELFAAPEPRASDRA